MFKAVILFAVVALAVAEEKRQVVSEGIWNGASAIPGYSGLVDPTLGSVYGADSIYGAGLGYKSGLNSLYHPSSVYSGLAGLTGYQGYTGLDAPLARGYGIPSAYGNDVLSSRFGGVARTLGSYPAVSSLAASQIYQPYDAQYGYSAGAYPYYKK